ncbi:MAG: hypothetical protein ACLP0J_13540 [Solirubrobacteraceae bacterium]
MRLVTTPGVRTRSRTPARSQSCPPPTRTRPPGGGPVAEIAAPIDAGELRRDTSERGLLTDTAAIHDGPEAGQLRGRAVLAPEG